MEEFYYDIREDNKFSLNRLHDSDRIYYSEIEEFYTPSAFRAFSVKFALAGYMWYRVNGEEYRVTPGHYLLSAKQPGVEAGCRWKPQIKSLCIDIGPETIGEVFSVLVQKNNYDPEEFCERYFSYPDFYESINKVENTQVGLFLKNSAGYLEWNDKIPVNKEWFFLLVENIIQQEYNTYRQLKQIRNLKQSTRKEILRRVQRGKEYMDDQFLSIEKVKDVAKEAAMSEYHFYRCFRSIFGQSTYQYLLKKRLDYAKTLIQSGELSLNEISKRCRFPDVFTFSKAFKRQFQIPPSEFRMQNQNSKLIINPTGIN